jgi:hypothetical protein
VAAKARVRAALGIEPWPDLAVRHAMFRTPEFHALRHAARPFDIEKPNKPVLERGHQTSFVLARWFTAAAVGSAFHVGYATGRHLFYLSRAGIACGGTDLPPEDTVWVTVPEGVFDEATCRRLLRVDFFRLTRADLRSAWEGSGIERVDVMFSEATFETLLPWRAEGASVPGYLALGPQVRHSLMHERFPEKLAELGDVTRNMIFIEPEPRVGGAGAVFEACARRLPEMAFTVWRFVPPFDGLFRLTPRHPTHQVVYAFTRDPAVLDALRSFAEPVA